MSRLCIQDIITPPNPCAGSVPCPQYFNAACVQYDGVLPCIPGITNPTLDTILEAFCNNFAACCTYTMKVHLTSEQILASNTTPIQLVPAPGAGKFIALLNLNYIYTFGTIAYANVGGLNPLVITFDNSTGTALLSSQLMLTGSASKTGNLVYAASEVVPTASFVNQGISIFSVSSDPTTGDGTVDIYVTFKIITV